MKPIIILLAVTLIYSCNSNRTQNTDSKKEELTSINISDLKQSPVVKEKLSNEQISRITNFQEILKEVNTISLDETIKNFQKDLNPDKEIAIWERIAKAYQNINNDNKNLSFENKNEAYKLLLYRSMMPKEQVLKKLKLESLSSEKASDFLDYYK